MAVAYTPDRTHSYVRDLLIATAVVMLAMLTLYLVGLDQGAVSQSGAFLHELMHDGRHLLGVPCH